MTKCGIGASSVLSTILAGSLALPRPVCTNDTYSLLVYISSLDCPPKSSGFSRSLAAPRSRARRTRWAT
eukprot:99251-Pleurochrysis_carterae.AAC.1